MLVTNKSRCLFNVLTKSGEVIKEMQTTGPFHLLLLPCFKANMVCKQEMGKILLILSVQV